MALSAIVSAIQCQEKQLLSRFMAYFGRFRGGAEKHQKPHKHSINKGISWVGEMVRAAGFEP